MIKSNKEKIMGWRNVIITQHAKLTYSMNMMIVQTKDGINQIPIDDINLLLVSTSQAVITSVWEKSPFLANFRLLLKRKILLNQGLLIPRFSRIS